MKSAPFPHDLVRLQAAWIRTYDDLAAPRPTPAHTELRRRLLMLSTRLWWHPFWSGPGSAPAARAQLRNQARALSRDAQW
ncbi:hypothetical protein O1Q96_00720 (plasmid) [Streptomyces sp. Qhu-G9]|uniref:hypothetical protein n=1 Tax=Streptomyces sp. Qhu-G9 TaxID=3452799 RepID=UPI0022AC363F|nr:hypothetical protein [Streptomyces aurantiacus]WAU78400.1 hypothetical protein O1Q96_00720 [Streptomyces aurantiacus]